MFVSVIPRVERGQEGFGIEFERGCQEKDTVLCAQYWRCLTQRALEIVDMTAVWHNVRLYNMAVRRQYRASGASALLPEKEIPSKIAVGMKVSHQRYS